MPGSEARDLVSLCRSAARLTFKRYASTKKRSPSGPSKSPVAAAPKKKPSASLSEDTASLKEYLAAAPPSSSAAVSVKAKRLLKNFKRPPSSSTISSPPNLSLHSIFTSGVTSSCKDDDDKSAELLSSEASSMLLGEMDLDWDEEYQERRGMDGFTVLPWFAGLSNRSILLPKKESTRGTRQKWVFKNTHTSRFSRLVQMCAKRLGSDVTLELFGKLGQETGLDGYNALIKACIVKARNATDEDAALLQMYTAYEIFKLVKEAGFQIKEETYGQFLTYLIDFGMVEEFFFFHELIRDENPDALPRLAYYEMLLWIRVNNEVKIQELCLSVGTEDAEKKLFLLESFLLAACESDHKEAYLKLLETLDITEVTSVSSLERIFRSLGKLFLEPFAERFFLALKESDIGAENISSFILEYAISIPNLVIEDIIIKFQTLHIKLGVMPSSGQFEKLIRHICELLKVHEAINVVDQAFESDIALSLETFHSILDACDRSCEFNLVHQIKIRMSRHNIKPTYETFKRMILLYVKMKDFEGAYGLISDCQEMNLTPTASMYNAILSGYFREKNILSARNVLKQMEAAGVKPDPVTYSYLIGNSQCEKDIDKFCDDLNKSGIAPTKQVFMALINAYASFGQFENAKQVIFNKRIPVKHLNEIKSVLIGALASNGQLSSALKLYEEMKGAECDLDPKSIRCLIEYFQSEGELNKSLELLQELNDSPLWTDACFRIISHCVRHENLRSTVDLLKQLKDKFMDAEVALEVLFDEVFCLFAEKEPTDMQFGLNLLQAIKEELGVRPSRKSLDFLLSACVAAKDSKTAFLIWDEYETAGLPYNVLSYVRMYQALLASGDTKSASELLKKTPKDDAHVRCVIKACQVTYLKSGSIKKKQKKKKKALLATLKLFDGLDAKTK